MREVLVQAQEDVMMILPLRDEDSEDADCHRLHQHPYLVNATPAAVAAAMGVHGYGRAHDRGPGHDGPLGVVAFVSVHKAPTSVDGLVLGDLDCWILMEILEGAVTMSLKAMTRAPLLTERLVSYINNKSMLCYD